jgi:hypothetical protein
LFVLAAQVFLKPKEHKGTKGSVRFSRSPSPLFWLSEEVLRFVAEFEVNFWVNSSSVCVVEFQMTRCLSNEPLEVYCLEQLLQIRTMYRFIINIKIGLEICNVMRKWIN